jgi:hypothetical protein
VFEDPTLEAFVGGAGIPAGTALFEVHAVRPLSRRPPSALHRRSSLRAPQQASGGGALTTLLRMVLAARTQGASIEQWFKQCSAKGTFKVDGATERERSAKRE